MCDKVMENQVEDPNFFYYAKFFLKIHGFSIDPNGNTFSYKLWAILNTFLRTFVLLSLAYNVLDKFPDTPLMVQCSTVVFGIFVNSFKITSLHRNIIKMSEFYQQMIDLWSTPDKMEKKVLMEHKFFTNIVSFFNCASLIAGITWWLLLPPAISMYENYTIGTTTWVTAYNITYFKALQTSPGYEIQTIVYYLITAMCVMGGCGFDSYFLESCFFLSGHFQIINQKFHNLKFPLPGNELKEFEKKVSSIINYYDGILDACATLQDLVKTAIIPFVLFDSIVICTCVYTLMIMNTLTTTIAFVGITSAAVGQIFILTYSGEVIRGCSQELIDAMYNSDWYSASPQQRKFMIICMMRSRRGFTFQMGVFQLTLPTLTRIIQTAGSYIALLNTL